MFFLWARYPHFGSMLFHTLDRVSKRKRKRQPSLAAMAVASIYAGEKWDIPPYMYALV